jgi:hypothetical protein
MSKVRLGHLDFALVEMDKISAAESFGFYSAEAQEIHICRGMDRRRSAEVIIHELLHGIVDFQNLAHILKDNEEPVVRGIAIGLATVIRDNQKLFADLVKALK